MIEYEEDTGLQEHHVGDSFRVPKAFQVSEEESSARENLFTLLQHL